MDTECKCQIGCTVPDCSIKLAWLNQCRLKSFFVEYLLVQSIHRAVKLDSIYSLGKSVTVEVDSE